MGSKPCIHCPHQRPATPDHTATSMHLPHTRLILATLLSFIVTPARAADVDFARQIQPILSDTCYTCHGPDSGKRKGDLRLDSLDPKEGPFAKRDGYQIIAPGKLE